MEQAVLWEVNNKLTWMKMQMGSLNASLVFGAIVPALQQECQVELEHQNIRYFGSEVIMDYIMFFKILLAIILQYFEVFL